MKDLADKPEHVPDALVRDVDIYNPGGDWSEDKDPHLVWKAIQDSCPPIFWTPRQGGHWILTRYADIKHVAETHRDFSSRETFLPTGTAMPQLPLNLDPPDHTGVRRLLNPSVRPSALKKLTAEVRTATVALIDELRPRGRCEFVGEFGNAIPVMAFLSLMGLPAEDHQRLNDIGTDITRIDDPEAYDLAKTRLSEYIRGWIAHFRAHPGPGAISDIIHEEVAGRRLSDEEVENMCVLLLAAGLDTVKSAIVFMANFLATNPQSLKSLVERPELVPNAVEEILRRFGSSNLCRVVRHDLTYRGVEFRAGDLIGLPFPLAGLDETENPDPLTVDFERKQIRHLDFGSGPHLCIGQALARQEISIFAEEWLTRIPEFRRVPGKPMKVMTGLAHIPTELWLEWDVSQDVETPLRAA